MDQASIFNPVFAMLILTLDSPCKADERARQVSAHEHGYAVTHDKPGN
jgi:hypothetical protein